MFQYIKIHLISKWTNLSWIILTKICLCCMKYVIVKLIFILTSHIIYDLAFSVLTENLLITLPQI